MSFFKRFTKIIAGQPAVPVKAKVVPAVKKPVVPVVDQSQLVAAQTQARELIIEAKDQAFQLKRQADAQAQQIINQSQDLKEKAVQKLAEVDHRLGAIEQREKATAGQEKHLQLELKKIADLKQQQLDKLEAIAQLSQPEAHDLILKLYQRRMAREAAEIIRDAETKAKAEAETKAKEILVEAMRHGATDYVAEYTVSLVKIADEDMKGRVIGREGRNIRTLEKVTGVEVDLDEPGVIRLSCFDPVRREIARITLEKLIADGRIQPSRIEEILSQTKKDISRIIRQEGEKLCHAVKVFNLPIEIIDMLGRFKYRFSYGQNMITHTLEETKIGLKLAYEVGADPNIVRLGCLLHDIGKVIDE
ncbi:MAG: Rnase Y domain-containing protein, partial [Patescibacteria group bacterium]|nr:Rnase Y domain-containing protein [Patescibacteria group bacterium]